VVRRDGSSGAGRSLFSHGKIVVLRGNRSGGKAGGSRDAGGDEVKSGPGVGVGRRRGRRGEVMAGGSERGGVESHVSGGDGGADEGGRGSVGVGSTGGTAGIVFGHNFVDGGREVDEKIVFEVPGGTSKVCLVGLGEQHGAVDKS
jgi:hypothetical protein